MKYSEYNWLDKYITPNKVKVDKNWKKIKHGKHDGFEASNKFFWI